MGLVFVLQPRPVHLGLVCSSFPSGRDFAASFLQIIFDEPFGVPPRDGHPCYWLTLPAAKRVRDLHPRVIAHAGRTKKSPAILQGFYIAPEAGLEPATL